LNRKIQDRPRSPPKRQGARIYALEAEITKLWAQIGALAYQLHLRAAWTASKAGASLVLGLAPRFNRSMIPTAQRAQIVEALKLNPNASAVAKEIGGVSHGTVWAIAHRAGIDLGAGGWKKFPAEKRAKIAAALRLNPNARAVAVQVGDVSRETVNTIAKEANIRLAAVTKRLSPEKRAQIVEALQANPNGCLVARHVGGVSARTVQKIAKKAGIKLLTRGDRHRSRREGAAGSPS
jgi:hypothetical protein